MPTSASINEHHNGLSRSLVVSLEELASSTPLRLDTFCVQHLVQISRSKIQRLIGEGSITVNGKKVSKHRFLKEGDEVVIAIAQQTTPHPIAPTHDIPIIFEDAEILVVEKPTGVLVHPIAHRKEQEWTLVDFVREHVRNIGQIGDDAARSGIVHRLDREVSGVIVIAKTQAAFTVLKRQFQNRRVEKEYIALVHGIPAANVGEIRLKIGRSKTHEGKMAARPEHEDGKDAWTTYEIIQKLNVHYAMLRVRIHTGRTHQIRAHLAAIDHPVVGDRLYGSLHYKTRRSISRLFLHAVRLTFDHPRTGKHCEFSSDLPQEFDEFLTNGGGH